TFALAAIVSTALSSSTQNPFGGPGVRQELKVVKQFDKNGDGWLNAAERKTARDYVSSRGFSGRGFPPPGRGGRFGGFPGDGNTGPAEKGKSIAPADVTTYPNAAFYDETVLRTLFITFEDNDWEKELEAFHGTDVDVPATLAVDGKTFRDVGI